MWGRKYKLLKGELIVDPYMPSRKITIYRIKALRDIPHHEVVKGDIGGYVTDKLTLSHQGECWIGDNAIVHGATVTGNAMVNGEAIVYAGQKTTSQTIYRLYPMVSASVRDKVSALARITIEDEAMVTGNARLTAFSVSESVINPVKIKGKAYIGGSAKLDSPALIKDNVFIYGEAEIGASTRISDEVIIRDFAVIGREVTLSGTTKIYDNAFVGNNCMILGNLSLAGNVKVADFTKIDNDENRTITQQIIIEPGDRELKTQKTTGNEEKDALERLLEKFRKQPAWKNAVAGRKTNDYDHPKRIASGGNPSKMEKYMKLLNETLDALESYETDIVKIIKYPVMIDKTDEYTASMLSAKRAVSLIDPENEESEYYAAVLKFDKAFQIAEAHALKAGSSRLNPDEQKRAKRAHDLFNIAVDDAASENEKVNAYNQGLKQLEGIIVVPNQAIAALRTRAGISELKA